MSARPKWFVLLAMGLLAIGSISQARTWRVERDGSADFTTIQPAVNAAASGDTIQIGRGWFDEKELVTCPGWTEYVRVLVPQAVLTIIGSGPATTIGQFAAWDLSQGDHMGIVGGSIFGNQELHVSNMTFANMFIGVNAEDNLFVLDNCIFYGNCLSISSWDGSSTTIRNCTFQDVSRNGRHIFVGGLENIEIQNCMLSLDYEYPWPQRHISVENGTNAVIEDCELVGGSGAFGAGTFANVTVRRCLLDHQSNYAVAFSEGGSIEFEDCTFDHQVVPLRPSHDNNRIVARRCRFLNVSECILAAGYVGDVSIQDCDLARGNRGVVWIDDRDPSYPPVRTIDMTNNYWGSDDPDSIQAWIRDANDSNLARFRVDYAPFASESTPTEPTTWGALKSLFR
jgi:hypothetical protein